MFNFFFIIILAFDGGGHVLNVFVCTHETHAVARICILITELLFLVFPIINRSVIKLSIPNDITLRNTYHNNNICVYTVPSTIGIGRYLPVVATAPQPKSFDNHQRLRTYAYNIIIRWIYNISCGVTSVLRLTLIRRQARVIRCTARLRVGTYNVINNIVIGNYTILTVETEKVSSV